jgi:ATP-dependent helicase/nuclease subunit B
MPTKGKIPRRRDATAPVYVLSGGTGSSGRQVAETALAQFPAFCATIVVRNHVRTPEEAEAVLAEARADGWVIRHTEWSFPETAMLGGLRITGRIDRIEENERTGQWRILDYKTFDQLKTPQETHLRSARAATALATPAAAVQVGGRAKAWQDLQLPLYRWAAREALGAGDTVFGYFNLPKAVGETAITLWEDYDDALHASALHCAEEVAAAVAAGRFWPPMEDWRDDAFATLVHDDPAASFDVGSWPEANKAANGGKDAR